VLRRSHYKATPRHKVRQSISDGKIPSEKTTKIENRLISSQNVEISHNYDDDFYGSDLENFACPTLTDDN